MSLVDKKFYTTIGLGVGGVGGVILKQAIENTSGGGEKPCFFGNKPSPMA